MFSRQAAHENYTMLLCSISDLDFSSSSPKGGDPSLSGVLWAGLYVSLDARASTKLL